MQTFIDRYIEQGREQGRQEGRQQGMQQGMQQGRQEGQSTVLLRLIELKFGPPDLVVRQRVLDADGDTLLRWSERVLTAQSMDDIFG